MAVTAAPARPLTHRSALDLARAIRSGETSSRDVVEAHIERLRAVQPHINALAADRFEAARAEADAADRRVADATDADELPPLLGVPCTVKESIPVAGMPNCAGLLARREHRATESAPTATRLMEAGAIPLGVTNVSEMTMWIESQNFVYGRTSNAYDPRRVAGGSSGGEGAAVGSGGAPIGLGTDIGGSIRLPAFFNGVFGHKCSAWLVPNSAHFPPAEGAISRMLSLGPLARRAEDLMPVLRIVAGPDPGDPDTRADVELGDPESVDLRGRPAVVAQEASYLPVRRELREARDRAAEALGDAGMDVRRVPMRSMRRAVEYYLTALRDGSARSFRDLLEAEMGETARLGLRHTVPGALRRRGPHTWPTVILLGVERLAARTPPRMTRRALAAADALAREVEEVLDGGVMLHPPYPRTAPKHGRTVGRPWVIAPMAVFNLLGLPVTQVPLGLNSRGIPLGVQVAGGMDDDHVTIAAALELERRFGGWVPPRI
ncbi:MAG: aspartyl-tRNA(Asn)/glutamyl-tRNA(Gln) amidotransferase subunit [Solirubrobacteraceae bacterium]|jgi:fatty acid amide hydrolase 2|nr:aspartyl-tRNA(Asn)/glutamyl-tRNA(Gln) amidotransferase subunit [Solirubrobacteraceae bacterium]